MGVLQWWEVGSSSPSYPITVDAFEEDGLSQLFSRVSSPLKRHTRAYVYLRLCSLFVRPEWSLALVTQLCRV